MHADLSARALRAILAVHLFGGGLYVRAGNLVDDREIDEEIERIRARIAEIRTERMELGAALTDLLSQRASLAQIDHQSAAARNAPTVTTASSSTDKMALFRRLFAGRPDVFPVRWENRKTAKSGYAPACTNKCGECPHQAFIPVSDDIIEKHLRGGDSLHPSGDDFVAGVYPLLPDETCWFLAADFDKENWAADALAMLETCRAKGVPAALERSRSGNGPLDLRDVSV